MNALRSLLKRHALELGATGVALVVYCAFSGPMLWRQSGAPHFVYQAWAWLQGHLYVDQPPNLNDWVRWDGHWYVSFPPFPALLMLPFVAINGLPFNDVFFTVCLSAVNVGLFAGVLKSWRAAGRHARPDWQIGLLTAFFAFGSVYFYTSIRGEVWFTAHVAGVTLTLLYLWAALDARRPLMAGLILGCAALTRANLAFAFPFFLIECFFRGKDVRTPSFDEGMRRLVLFGAAGAAAFLPALYLNHLRWPDLPGGGWTEFGHSMLYHNRVNQVVDQYGLFNLHFLPNNFRAAFLLLPTVQTNPLRFGFDGNGMSMLITTPLLILVPFSLRRNRTVVALAVTAGVIALPGLLYMNTGWYQFGYRFSNDYLPYLFFILALGRLRLRVPFVVLGTMGIVVNTWGAIVFGR